jgi:hypothetical protein
MKLANIDEIRTNKSRNLSGLGNVTLDSNIRFIETNAK